MVVADLNVLEHAERVLGEYRRRAVQRDQIRGDRVAIDTHEAHRETGGLLARQTRLEQTDDALLLLSSTQQQDVRLPCLVDAQLIGGNQRHATPGQKGRTQNRRGRWRNSAPRALAAECGDGLWMSQEEGGLLPDAGEQLVQIIRRRSALARFHLERFLHILQQAIVGIVDELALLTLLDLFDRQAELLADLIVGMAIEVGDSGMYVNHRGDRAQRILPRLLLVVDKGLRQLTLIACSACDLDVTLILDLIDPVGSRLHRYP